MAASSPITLSRIETVAPDQASLKAARKLLNASKWPTMEHDAEMRLLWGACQGSGASAYSVTVEISDLGAKCSCPSRKFPCKHAIALMWWMAEQPERFSEGEIPQWVQDWQGRRRRTTPADAPKPSRAGKSAQAAAMAEPERPRDPEQARRQRERVRKARETSIRRGLEELDVWIGDQLDRGFGAFGPQASEQCRLMAQRLVDAKAGGIAAQVEALPALYFQTPEARRYDILLETLGALHLLAEAYRKQDELPDDLRAEVRTRVGWVMTREELLVSSDAPHVSATWTVCSTRSESQPDRLVRYETWLAARENGDLRTALLLDFVPASAASKSAPSLEPGARFEAELAYYPSATPLRAQIVTQGSVSAAPDMPSPPEDLPAALARYDDALTCNPWISQWPLACRDVHVARDGAGEHWVVSNDEEAAVPLAGDQASVLVGVKDVELVATFDGRWLTPLAANSALGPLWCTS